MTPEQMERFEALTHFEPMTGCLLWTGALSAGGYGLLRRGSPMPQLVHRLAYEHFVGPIAPGMMIDHVRTRGCASRACCNPMHLEPVTNKENVRRGPASNEMKTHCPAGHPYDGDNLYTAPTRNQRLCRACQREHDRKRRPPGSRRKSR